MFFGVVLICFLNGKHQIMVYADYVNILAGSVHTVKVNGRSFGSGY